LRKAAFVSIIAGAVCLSVFATPVRGQEFGGFGGVHSFGFSSSYSPTSTHIFIGDAKHRRIWTLGAEYTHLLRLGPLFRLDYEGSMMPLFEETDPTVTGTIFTFAGQSFTTVQTPVRVIDITNQPVGNALAPNGSLVPLYALFARQDTYGASIAPLGARITALPRRRIQPSFALDLGFVVSARDIPVDQADQFNYLFSLGPGIQFFTDAHTSWRFEYIYRHISNAGQGLQNPGIDQGVVRVTVSLHR
jgi:hypothetical protein